MKKVIMLLLPGIVFLGVSPVAQGAGFLIYEHGAAAMAMGGAWVGVANNPTAIFHNPAGIAWLDGTQISVGTTLITQKASLSLPNYPDPTFQTVDVKDKWFYPSTFYISHKFSDRITAGFGFFTPYGLGLEWPEDYPLKYISVKDDMKTFIFNPVVAVKVSDNFSLAVGASYIHATISFDLVQRLDLADAAGGLLPPNVLVYDVPVNFEASGSSFGLNAGALYKGEKFSLGFNWRGGFKIEFDGDLNLDTSGLQIPFPYNLFIDPSAIPTSGDASTAFNFPHILGVGTAFNLTEKLLLTVDIHYVLWSTYDKFTVEVGIPGFDDKVIEENWEDSFLFRGGIQYQVSESFALRAGALYDQTPQPTETMDPILPDADRWALTGGFGYKSGGFEINVAYQYEKFQERTSPNREILIHPLTGVNLGEGPYKVMAHLIGISLGYNF